MMRRNKGSSRKEKHFVNSLKHMEKEILVKATITRYYLFPKQSVSVEMIEDMLENYPLDQRHASRDYYRIRDKLKKYKILD